MKQLLYLFGVAAFALAARAQEGDVARSTLAGVREFGVVVYLNKAAEDGGLSAERIATAAEASLRKARLPVVAPRVLADAPKMPRLSVAIETLKIPDTGLCVYTIHIQFYQMVSLSRDSKQEVLAPTWGSTNYGSVGILKTDSLRTSALEHVDEFINAFAAENP